MNSRTTLALGSGTVFSGYLAGVISVLISGGAPGAAEQYLSAEATPDWWLGFLSGPLFVLLAGLCGVFLLGWLTVYPLVFYKAYGLGYTAGLLLAAYGTKGFLPLGLCLFPSAAGEFVLLIRQGQLAFPTSLALLRHCRGAEGNIAGELRRYALRSLVLLQCSSAVLLWDLFLSPLILSGIRNFL